MQPLPFLLCSKDAQIRALKWDLTSCSITKGSGVTKLKVWKVRYCKVNGEKSRRLNLTACNSSLPGGTKSCNTSLESPDLWLFGDISAKAIFKRGWYKVKVLSCSCTSASKTASDQGFQMRYYTILYYKAGVLELQVVKLETIFYHFLYKNWHF